jgi:hypothetical protein
MRGRSPAVKRHEDTRKLAIKLQDTSGSRGREGAKKAESSYLGILNHSVTTVFACSVVKIGRGFYPLSQAVAFGVPK